MEWVKTEIKKCCKKVVEEEEEEEEWSLRLNERVVFCKSSFFFLSLVLCHISTVIPIFGIIILVPSRHHFLYIYFYLSPLGGTNETSFCINNTKEFLAYPKLESYSYHFLICHSPLSLSLSPFLPIFHAEFFLSFLSKQLLRCQKEIFLQDVRRPFAGPAKNEKEILLSFFLSLAQMMGISDFTIDSQVYRNDWTIDF